jgi:hypothetical protein
VKAVTEIDRLRVAEAGRTEENITKTETKRECRRERKEIQEK